VSEALVFLGPALAICLVIASIHVYLGMHVLEREVIFVDLSLAQLAALGATPLAAGASDWVVYGSGGGYEADEAYFLRCILSTIEGALRGVIDDAALSDWLLVRRGQLERGELVFVARQLDFVGQRAAG
jgi:hypothetical protein